MIKGLFIRFIRFYQKHISPALPPMCRYYPTCSNYMLGAIEKHGLMKGVLMGTLRLLRCNRLWPGGYDPVPEPGEGLWHHRH